MKNVGGGSLPKWARIGKVQKSPESLFMFPLSHVMLAVTLIVAVLLTWRSHEQYFICSMKQNMDIICISIACLHGEVKGEEADILEALMVFAERDRIYVHLFLQATVFQALWMLSVTSSICWRAATRCYGDCSVFSANLREDSEEYFTDQSSGINCIIPWTLFSTWLMKPNWPSCTLMGICSAVWQPWAFATFSVLVRRAVSWKSLPDMISYLWD